MFDNRKEACFFHMGVDIVHREGGGCHLKISETDLSTTGFFIMPFLNLSIIIKFRNRGILKNPSDWGLWSSGSQKKKNILFFENRMTKAPSHWWSQWLRSNSHISWEKFKRKTLTSLVDEIRKSRVAVNRQFYSAFESKK